MQIFEKSDLIGLTLKFLKKNSSIKSGDLLHLLEKSDLIGLTLSYFNEIFFIRSSAIQRQRVEHNFTNMNTPQTKCKKLKAPQTQPRRVT